MADTADAAGFEMGPVAAVAAADVDPPAGADPIATGPPGDLDGAHAPDTASTAPSGEDGDEDADAAAGGGEGGNTPLVNNIIAVMGHVDERMEEMDKERREREGRQARRKKRRTCLKKTGHVGNILTALVVSIVSLYFGIYGLYHSPANDIALESLKAAEWSNYYNWVWTICPAEQARNMTVPECDEAQNHAVHAPKRPQNFDAQQTLGYRLARRLLPLINGSYEFELSISRTDETCGLEDGDGGMRNITTCSRYNPWPPTTTPPPVRELSTVAHNLRRRLFDLALTFPLPAPIWRSRMRPPHVPGKLVSLFITLIICLFLNTFVPHYVFYRLRTGNFGSASGKAFFRNWAYFNLACWIILYLEIVLGGRIVDLAVWIAQDNFLEGCLATRGQGLDGSLDSAVCTRILSLASGLDLSDQAKVWGIWRGFFFGRIQEAKFDGAVARSLLVNLCLISIPSMLMIPYASRMIASSVPQRYALVIRTSAARREPAATVDEEQPQQPLIDLSPD